MIKHFLDPEISWLSFNRNVLEEAAIPENPLYERIKFIAIFSSNLDEFFRVKFPSILLDKSDKTSALREKILAEVHSQQESLGQNWYQNILPELSENNIHLYSKNDQSLLPLHQQEVERYFKTEVLSYIQIVYLKDDLASPYFLQNRQLYFYISLLSDSDVTSYCYINITSEKLARFRTLSTMNGKQYIIWLDDIIRNCLHLVFRNQRVISCHSIKLNRDEDFEIENEWEGNLAKKILEKVKKRKTGVPTRMLYDATMDQEEIKSLRQTFGLKKDEVLAGGQYHNLFDLFSLPCPDRKKFLNPTIPPILYPPFEGNGSIFDAIEKGNQLLHFPYHSYHYVLQFFNEAAIDVRVKEIKVTLYRISQQSIIANALISAAKNGKKVTVFVEIKARFDEDNNLYWADEMKKAGIKILYSMPDLKVHAKIALISMQTGKTKIKHFAYMSTGNFNEKTATVYADHGFFTADPTYTKDVINVFSFLKNPKVKREVSHLLVAGFNLKQKLLQYIDQEIKNHKNNLPSGITLKVNGLDEKDIIQKLIEASKAGVKIDIICRGICTLRPGIKGLSENIRIYRIVDMFLEHARVYIFHNNGKELVYLSSADLMSRNLNHRIEVAFPMVDEKLCAEIKQILDFQMADNTKMRILDKNGKGVHVKVQSTDNKRAQTDTYHWITQKDRKDEA
ncbi:MAG: polyphosphate kinase 1 [Saprospiraceae bacterium]|nr:polyphosphate kinase 1 [Saprospiraceae bacterium]